MHSNKNTKYIFSFYASHKTDLVLQKILAQ